jgi:heterodisulfide reductase subunit A
MTAALGIADMGYETVLLEKGDVLGGNALRLNRTWKGEEIRPKVAAMAARVEGHPRIKVLKNATLKSAAGSVGNFVSEIDVAGSPWP